LSFWLQSEGYAEEIEYVSLVLVGDRELIELGGWCFFAWERGLIWSVDL